MWVPNPHLANAKGFLDGEMRQHECKECLWDEGVLAPSSCYRQSHSTLALRRLATTAHCQHQGMLHCFLHDAAHGCLAKTLRFVWQLEQLNGCGSQLAKHNNTQQARQQPAAAAAHTNKHASCKENMRARAPARCAWTRAWAVSCSSLPRTSGLHQMNRTGAVSAIDAL